MRRAFVALTAAAWLFALAPAARGHAALQSSDPAAGAELAQSPSSVTLSFTEEPELSLSAFRVLDLEGTPFHEGSRAISGDDRSVRIGLKELPKGAYSVAWRVVSRVDGHLTAGVFSFGVEVSPSEVETPKPEADRADIDPVAVGGRWLLLAGFTVLLGGAVTGMFVFARPPRAVLGAMAMASAASFAGVGLLVDVQRRAAGVGLGDLASTLSAEVWRSGPH